MATQSPSKDAVPHTLYVFVNEQLPFVVHNLRLTRRISAGAAGGWTDAEFVRRYAANTLDWRPFVPNPDATPWLSFFAAGLYAGYGVEYNAELCRRANFPTKPSRLSGVFAFGDDVSCQRAAALYNWPLSSVRRFRLLDHPLTRVAKVNMEVISLARMAYRVSSTTPETDDHLWRHYWSGGGTVALDLPAQDLQGRRVVESGVIWEYLIDGALELLAGETIA